jgi:hypothetical protein
MKPGMLPLKEKTEPPKVAVKILNNLRPVSRAIPEGRTDLPALAVSVPFSFLSAHDDKLAIYTGISICDRIDLMKIIFP